MHKLENLTHIELVRHIKVPVEPEIGKRDMRSWCSCRKYQLDSCIFQPIERDELVYKVRWRINTTKDGDGNKEIWYRNERWKMGCFLEWLEANAYIAERTLPKYEPKAKVPRRSKERKGKLITEKFDMSEAQIKFRRGMQLRIAGYRKRIKLYEALPPTSKRFKALDTCKRKLKEETYELEKMEKLNQKSPSMS